MSFISGSGVSFESFESWSALSRIVCRIAAELRVIVWLCRETSDVAEILGGVAY